MFSFQLSGQKQQIKLTLKGPALKRLEKPVLPQEDDSEWLACLSRGWEGRAGRGRVKNSKAGISLVMRCKGREER